MFQPMALPAKPNPLLGVGVVRMMALWIRGSTALANVGPIPLLRVLDPNDLLPAMLGVFLVAPPHVFAMIRPPSFRIFPSHPLMMLNWKRG